MNPPAPALIRCTVGSLELVGDDDDEAVDEGTDSILVSVIEARSEDCAETEVMKRPAASVAASFESRRIAISSNWGLIPSLQIAVRIQQPGVLKVVHRKQQ